MFRWSGPPNDKFKAMAKQFVSDGELASVSRYTYVSLYRPQDARPRDGRCGKDLTRACTIEKLRALKDFDTGGLSAPVSFDNPQQLSGTAVAVYQYDVKAKAFKALTGFELH